MRTQAQRDAQRKAAKTAGEARTREAQARRDRAARSAHDCAENAVPYTSDGALGHGWECGICRAFLQAG